MASLRLAAALVGLASMAAAASTVGPNVNVSHAIGTQSEVRVAIDATNPVVLLAGSNSHGEGAMRVYGSTDAGRHWSSEPLQPIVQSSAHICSADPAVAIGLDGRQYFLFVHIDPCGGETSKLVLMSRTRASTAWKEVKAGIGPQPGGSSFDDNPWLAIDTAPDSPYENRIYVAWFRYDGQGEVGLLVSSSDDAGVTWRPPVRVSDALGEDGYPSIAVGDQGAVYVAWHAFDAGLLKLDRSLDGGQTFGKDVRVPVRVRDQRGCPNGVHIQAQPRRCVRADPTVTAAGKHVFLTYADTGSNGSQDVFAATFDQQLRPLALRSQVTPEGQKRDQFWPAAAVDSVTKRLWLCFYDTGTGSRRSKASFSCTTSLDGFHWVPLMRVASQPSNERRSTSDPSEYGDYEGLAVFNNVAHPTWSDSRDDTTNGEEIYTATVRVMPLNKARIGGRTLP